VTAAARAGLRPGDNASVVVSAEHGSEYGLRQVAAARLPELEAALTRALAAAGPSGQDAREVARTVRGAMKRLAGELPELWAGSLFNVSPSFWAARLARAFDLTGPVCALEAGAAASSMAGLEVACARLADREVDAALWATADVRVGELRHGDERAAEWLSRAAAPTALDASADGYLPGEAATVCVLRRLSDARGRGEPIYGVIRAIGSSFAPPRGNALIDEAALALAIERAHARCDVAAEELAFVECFGSGHPPSDAAEVAALGRTLGAGRTRPLPLGAVMPNVGHTGAAAGAVSLVKALLSLGAQTLPATAGVRAPITGDGASGAGGLQVATRNLALGQARFAAVNAAGAGGTHYHVIVERGSHALELGA
jgi:acyl transferase domain-containing protein